MYIIWNESKVRFLLKSPAGDVGRDLFKRSVKVAAAARRQVGVKSGKLRTSIKVSSHSATSYGQKYSVGSDVSYALIHHEGSRPHVILPVRAQNLVFISRGKLIVTNRVNHPGTKPNKYLSDNLYHALG